MQATERFLESWPRLEAELGDEPAWLRSQRAAGRARFGELGFPTLKDEEWKYTNVRALSQLSFELADAPAGQLGDSARGRAVAEQLEAWRLPGMALAVFVDGCFVSELSELDALPGELRVGSLREARADGLVAEHLGQVADCSGNAFGALNAGLWRDGLFLHATAGLKMETPLLVLHLMSDAERACEQQLRHLIVAERGAEVTLIEHYLGVEGAPSFRNVVAEVVVGENALVDRYKVEVEGRQTTHIERHAARLGRDSRYRSHVFSLGGQLVRNDLGARLTDTGAESLFNGLFLVDGERHVDHHTVVDHEKPHCQSHELYKGILADKARGVFNGKVFVREGAIGTDARQSNKNLLLSPSATIDTKPQLEIFADDVKCTHGATVGQLDKEALFYLRTRGIDAAQAKSMLIRAFAAELLDDVRLLPLRMQLEGELERRLTV